MYLERWTIDQLTEATVALLVSRCRRDVDVSENRDVTQAAR